jgi:hypothetical protein
MNDSGCAAKFGVTEVDSESATNILQRATEDAGNRLTEVEERAQEAVGRLVSLEAEREWERGRADRAEARATAEALRTAEAEIDAAEWRKEATKARDEIAALQQLVFVLRQLGAGSAVSDGDGSKACSIS